MDDLPPEDLPNFHFTGNREYLDDRGDLQFAIRLDLEMDQDPEQRVGTLLTGCLVAKDRPGRDSFIFVSLDGSITEDDPPEARLRAKISEDPDADEVDIFANIAEGFEEDENPQIGFSSDHDSYHWPEPRQRAALPRTCDQYRGLYGDGGNLALRPALERAEIAAVTLPDWLSNNAVSLPDEPAQETQDERFEGTFCQRTPARFCEEFKVKVGPLSLGTRTECADVTDARITLEHFDGRDHGQLYGIGRFDLDGRRVKLVASGQINERGVASASLQMAGADNRTSGYRNMLLDSIFVSTLGVDHRITVNAHDRTLRLGKQACGNRNPRITLVSQGGESLVWGRNHCFTGTVTQDEDATFPPERLQMSSSRDGEFLPPDATIDSAGPMQITRCNTGLSPGNHEIEFVARDSGGLSSRVSVDVQVSNQPPGTPVLVQPREDDTVIAGGLVIFEGKAFDREEGLLAGNDLNWRIREPDGNFFWIGSGRRAFGQFPEPGLWVVELTAEDGAGEQSKITREIKVLANEGNTTPRVTIEVPDHLSHPGHFGGAFAPGTVTFRGTVDDSESPDSSLSLRWDATPVLPPGSPLEPVLDSTLAVFDFPPSNNRAVYEIVFRATDLGGLEGKKVIRVLIAPAN